MFQFSFYSMSYTKVRGFVGLKNYLDIFQKEEYARSLLLSLYYMGGALVQMVLALYFATVLSFGVKGGGIFKGVLFFPYLINGIAIGFIFKFFFTRGFVLDTALQSLGINLESLPYWLRDQSINNISLVGTSVWKYMGQNMVLFIGAIMSVDPTLYEAATVDGANKWHQFRFVILPSIRTVLMLNLILAITGSLSAFEPPYVIMGGGANGTATYFIKMHETAHTLQKVGMASAMAVFLMLIILIAAVIQQVAFKRAFKRYDA
jgi:multiple sugar transport system permease protein